MKILICVSEYPPYASGAGNVVYNTVKYFEKAGHECSVCSPIGPDIKICNESIIKRIYKFGYLYYLYGIIYFWYKAQIYVEQNLQNYDVLLLHNLNPVIAWTINLKKIKTYLIFHSTYYGFYNKCAFNGFSSIYYKYISQLEKKSFIKLNDQAIFIGVSTAICEELLHQGIREKNIRYISNGVDVNKFKPSSNKGNIRKQLNLPTDRILILSVGRLVSLKQIDKMIAVFSLIESKRTDIVLIIAGMGECYDELKKLVTKYKLKNIIFKGYVSADLTPDLYSCSDYFIISSKYEGQPLTLLEAMASGLSCIVSNIPNLLFVKETECGIVVDFDRENNAAENILDYISSDLPNIHSINARRYAEKKFSWEHVVENYLEEFD